jgi:pimeloyl-ACP methyl ester carboxylesterase
MQLQISFGWNAYYLVEISGTVDTLSLSCFENDFEAIQMLFDYSLLSNSSEFAAQRLWARAGIDANLCYNRAHENGTLISTAFTARDLISIVDALGEDGMLRYYGKWSKIRSGCNSILLITKGTNSSDRIGLSYGTTLGSTVAAMFPDRIDKMVLDGVQNPQEYYNGLRYALASLWFRLCRGEALALFNNAIWM